MKYLALLLALAAPVQAFDGPYFTAIWENPKHPLTSAGSLLTAKGGYDGVSTKVALVWHKADPDDSLIPAALQNIGVKSFGWTLLDCGAGYGNGTGKLDCGTGINFAPTLLGPIAAPLKASTSKLAQAIGAIVGGLPDGSGLNVGPTWAATPVQHGVLLPINHWGSHLDFFFGASFGF